ncbi:MAG: APC family permease [Solirubrobacteraceae bacterium]
MATTTAPAGRASTGAGADAPGLRRRSLPFREVFAQSLAGTGPSGSLAFGPALVFASAGHGTWISYLLSLVGLLFVGWAFSIFGTRIASAGSMYPYAAEGLGPLVGILVAWALVVAYVVIAMVVVAGSGQFFGQFLVALGWHGAAGKGPQVVLALLIGVAALMFALRDVKISTRAAMVLELISIVCITAVLVATVIKHGIYDSAEFKLHGMTVHGIVLGMVLAITGYVGFESAASLGQEAGNPRRAVPRAIRINVLACGAYFIIGAYVYILGFDKMGLNITASQAPLNDLARGAGVGWLRYVIDLGIAIGFIAVTVAALTAVSRILFNMSHERLLPSALGETSEKHKAPYVALGVVGAVVTGTVVISEIAGLTPVDILGYYGSIATYGFIVAYLVISLAALGFLHRRHELRPLHFVPALIGAVAMGAVLYYSVIPVPAYPYNIFPYVFLGLLVPGIAAYLVLRARRPEVAKLVGSTVEELEAPPAPAAAGR